MRSVLRAKTFEVGARGAAAARLLVCALLLGLAAGSARAQDAPVDEEEFGPVVRAYLGYLKAEEVVTDDRASRREVSPAYVRRNSNRVRALRQMAIRIARETKNDFLPELYAVARDELGTLFEVVPSPDTFSEGEVVENTFRYLGPVRAGELFYLFARLDIYEQAEVMKQQGGRQSPPAARPAGATAQTGDARPSGTTQQAGGASTRPHDSAARPADAQAPATRPRRVPPPDAARPPQ
jgi:hypothetical protein